MDMKQNYIYLFLVSVILLLQDIKVEAASMEDKTHNRLLEIVKAQQVALSDDALVIWELAELGFMENKSSLILQRRLKNAGFTVTPGVAGMPTAFVASFKIGLGSVIGLLAEFDALPGLSQDATKERKEIPGKQTAHGCGHNLIGAATTASAIALKQWLAESGTQGEIRLYGCPAEEGGSGKIYLVREGFFKDVDAVIHWHPSDYNGYYTSTHMANISGKFRFHGISAHAAAAPERGRSALDGVQVMNLVVEFLREHIPDKTRIHYVITNGGKAPNVVPDFAEVFLTVRHSNPQVVKDVWDRIVDTSRGAAIATETTSDYEIISGMYPLLINRTLVDIAARNFKSLSIPAWNNEQMDFANGIAKSLEKPGEFNPAVILPPYPAKEVNASTDVGDISWVVPTVGIFSMSWIPGTAAHTWQAVAASDSSLGVQGAFVAAEVIVTTAAELFLNPEIVQASKKEMFDARGKDYIYEPMLGNRKPALNYREE
ncbi:MAG: p-aminobenzoyl-glutamate hydrolase subunit B [Candidatus Ordinivivax streblomastigis]|uniref:p-aminobenzoyl-glutamate hydrolase subunit B n=1 Tax=Candidatus Ordinivivax streblomastigis TaxID=2540710 RepID=A0A5M8NUI6_9BACT|nr:MAG: p-aminobenzoyl-glutamate hydrolase subunit B [Candidatus Ordinivivax streblomastigis]